VLELVLPDHSRLPLAEDVTIGRAADNTVRLADPSVSRTHARIAAGAGGDAVLEDAGSSYGTWLDGHRVRGPTPLRQGSRIRIGDLELVVDRTRGEEESGRTVIVPEAGTTTRFGERPRLRGGYALKRLEAAEGPRRWVLKDLRSGRLVRLAGTDADLLALLDGTRSLAELAHEAERRLGRRGPARLAMLLASLGERGFLAPDPEDAPQEETGRLRRLAAPRTVAWSGASALFERLYRHGGRLLVSRGALAPLGVLAAAGAAVFAYLVLGRYGTPFVVASKVGIGGVVFVLGRLAVAAVHETAHGLVMASFGRRVREAGLKVVLIFPYVYVDTSDVWFEPRRRRIAVSAAGPASDLCLGGAFALCCLGAAPGTLRDVFFQLAFGAYVGAFFNLNPLLERDGYHILVDVLREPALRRRARSQLRRRIAEGPSASDSPVLLRYSLFALGWSLAGAGVAVALSLRYEHELARLAPAPIVWIAMCVLWGALFLPVLAAVGPPLLHRLHVRAG
jgi:putative peptide zinc metalloprotease protein